MDNQYLAAWYDNLAATSSDATARQILMRVANEYRDGTRCPLCGYCGVGCGGGTHHRPQCPKPVIHLDDEDDGVIVIDHTLKEEG